MKLVEIAALTETECREHFERVRWPSVIVCPHCLDPKGYRLGGAAGAKGYMKCGAGDCRKKFTVKVGTVMEDSPISYKKWLLAFCLMAGSKKGFSAHQLHRSLGITYKSAWFMFHRIRFAMVESPDAPLLGGPGGVVEVDETYVGGKRPRSKGGRPSVNDQWKTPVVALVERNGRARVMPKARVTAANLKGAIREHVDTATRIMTDEFPSYRGLEKEFATHETVCHNKGEYARGDVYSNSVESYFALLKRGVHGTFHHVSKGHLHRYCNEFAWRWSFRKVDDFERMNITIANIEGKRLTYRDSFGKGDAIA